MPRRIVGLESSLEETPSPEEAQRILKGLQDYSKPFGTNVSIEEMRV
jgi:hypothetical protein